MSRNRILSIEVGYATIRIADMERGLNPKIYNLIEIATPELSVSDGYLVSEKMVELKKAILEALKKNKIRTKKVVFTLFSSKIFTREVTLPVMKEKELRGVLEENITDYFPIELEDYVVTSTVIDTIVSADQTIKNKLLLIATEKKLIKDYAKLAELCRFTLIDVDYVGNSVYQLLKNVPRSTLQMYVKVEAENTLIMILEDKKLALQRSLNYGIGLGEIDKSQMVGNIRPILGTISRVMHFYSGQSYVSIDRAYLIGQGSEYVEVFNEAGEDSELSYEAYEEFDNVRLQKNVKAEGINDFIASIGAAIAPVKLIDYKAAYKRINYFRAGILMIIFYLMLIAALGLSAYLPYFDAKFENETLSKKAAMYSEAVEIHDTYVSLQSFYESFNEGDELTNHPNDGLLSFFEELEKKLPSDVTVTALNSDDDKVVLQIEVDNKKEAAGIIDMLRNFDTLMRVSVTSINGNESDEEGRISFAITGEYYPTVTVEEEAE